MVREGEVAGGREGRREGERAGGRERGREGGREGRRPSCPSVVNVSSGRRRAGGRVKGWEWGDGQEPLIALICALL